jgi:hypothetical protein
MVYFNKDKNNFSFGKVIDKEEGIIASPALIAEKRIYRYDPETNEEFYVYFTKETIKKLSQNFLKTGNHINATEEHINPIKGVHLIYSWIVENEQDQIITKYGFKDIPVGSWCVMYKIENDELKEKIKSGEITGLSIEAWLSHKFSKEIEKDEVNEDLIIEKIKELLKQMK